MKSNEPILVAGDDGMGYYKVVFMDNKTGVRLLRTFNEHSFCSLFVNSIKHSKRVTPISYPILNRY